MNKANFLLSIAAGVATIFGSGIAFAQDVYVSDNSDNMITIIAPGGSTTTISSGLLNGPTGLAFNSQGDLFIANNGGPTPNTGDIVEYDPNSNTWSTFATGLANPRGLAFDSAGNLYVANQSSGTVTEFLGGIDNPKTFASGLTFPNGIAVDAIGDLYVTQGLGSNLIARITPGGTVDNFDTSGKGLNGPNGIVFGPNGDLYVANRLDPSIEQVTLGLVGSTFISNSPINNGLDDSRGLAFDANGDLYVTDYGNNTVTEYNTAGQLINTFTNDLSGPCFDVVSTGLAVPEPSTYAMLLAGLGAIYFIQRRRAAPVKI
jgi:DNA-binding beta-propeller fold protein YncE